MCDETTDRLTAFRPAIEALALDRLGDPELARDIAQDILERALRHCGELRDPAALGPWLRRIALNRCREWQRRPAIEYLALPPVPPTMDTAEVVIRRAMLRRALDALRDLPENNRLALVMHVMHGQSYQRIANFLGVPASTVESRIHRARAALRRDLAAWLDETAEESRP